MHLGWKSNEMAKEYIENPKPHRLTMAALITGCSTASRGTIDGYEGKQDAKMAISSQEERNSQSAKQCKIDKPLHAGTF